MGVECNMRQHLSTHCFFLLHITLDSLETILSTSRQLNWMSPQQAYLNLPSIVSTCPTVITFLTCQILCSQGYSQELLWSLLSGRAWDWVILQNFEVQQHSATV